MIRLGRGSDPGGGNGLAAISFIPPVLLLLSAAFLFLPARPLFAASSPANPHAYFRQPGQCPRCHIDSGTPPATVRISAASVDFCLECHRIEELGVTHPLKVKPGDRFRGITVPPDYVLSADGKILCLTCHTAHGPEGNHYLRRAWQDPSGNNPICSGCHGTR